MKYGNRAINYDDQTYDSTANHTVKNTITPSRSYIIFRQVFDYVVAFIGIVVLAPLMLLIAILIRLESTGPVLFRQRRVGKDGKEFSFLKFRSMYEEAARYSMVQRDNPMVTKVGRILRKTSLDEIPQLFNVLRGDMSLIGPRPEQPFIVEQYEPWQHRRHVVKPGITGWWQVNGRNDLPMHENTEFDIYYIENQSVILDFKILLLTVREVLQGRGAY